VAAKTHASLGMTVSHTLTPVLTKFEEP